MNSTYQAALDGTLVSQPGAAPPTPIFVYNYLPVPVIGYYVETNGLHVPIGTIVASQDIQLADALVGDAYIFTSAYTGAFVCAFQITAAVNHYYVVSALDPTWTLSSSNAYFYLTQPNDIGPIPVPTKTVPIPQNSPLIMVGGGTIPPIVKTNTPPTGYVTREQYWCLLGDSYSIQPGESRTISYTVTSGKQRTSSTQENIAASVGASAHAGWGPVSASLSASLNASASAFQQVTVTEETQTYVSDTVTNNTTDAELVLRWQMVDLVTVYDHTGAPQSNVTSNSVVMALSYKLNELQAAAPRAMVEQRRNSLPRLGAANR